MKNFAYIVFFIITLTGSANASPLSNYYGMQAELARNTAEEQQALQVKKKHLSQEQLQRKANELEAVLISKMIEPMFPEGKESMLFGGGQGSDIYRHLMVREYGKILQQGGGLGIAKNIAKNLAQ